jgi:thiol-disulfide isomerase/thioredoxin
MKSILRHVIIAVFGTCLLGSSAFAAPAPGSGVTSSKPAPAKPKVLGVLFYADWCASCKVLEPKLTAIKKDFAGQPVLFTRVDQTDAFTKEQSAMLANVLGVADIHAQQEGRTGHMLLIDTSSRRILGTLTRAESERELKAAIERALKG